MKKNIKSIQLIISFALLIALIFSIQVLGLTEVKEEVKRSEVNEGKISEELKDVISRKADDENISVSVWIKDIDYDKLEEESLRKLNISDESKEKEEHIVDYINVRRDLAFYYHEENNTEFYESISDNADIIYINKYSPNLILNVDKDYLDKLSEDEKIDRIDLFKDEKKVRETTNSIPAITADYTKGLGLTGNGVNVGILEYSDDSHAQTIEDIIYDIAPDSNIIMKYALNKLQDYAKLDELVLEGANVINYSAGYKLNAGTYTDFAKHIDYLVENYNITFVKSAGNIGSQKLVTDPGMAYNGITVGSINENDTASWTDDLFSSSFSCYEEVGAVASKPDLTAPGDGIYGSNIGTSFSAPHVVGVVAQLMDSNPVLKSYPGTVKSILSTGTWHQTADDYGVNLWSPYISDKEGAGVVDAKGSYNVLNGSNFNKAVINNGDFDYEGHFYVAELNKPVRVSLTWLKQTNLSDLDIRIYDTLNNLVGYSLSSTNNTELVEFIPQYSRGNYKFIIEGYNLSNIDEDICVSWQQK